MKKFSVKQFTVKPYQRAALEYLRPPEELTVTEWAELYRHMDSKSANIDGLWMTSLTPYLRGIMDEFNNYDTEEIVFVKPTQVGGTEAMINALGWAIAQDPGPVLMVYPSEDLAEQTSENRLKPMIKLSPPLMDLFDERHSSKNELQFKNMYIALEGSNSPAALSSRPIRYLFLDEVDKFQGATKREADPVSLATERTKSYPNRKIFKTSSPSLTTGHIWKAKENADIEKHYFIPCPHCGKYIELVFGQIKWPGKEDGMSHADRADLAVYVCQECACVITDRQKAAAMQLGRWNVVRGKARVARSVAFWINTLYSPFTRFAEIAKMFMAAKEDQDALHNFTNSWLAEPWEATKLKLSSDLVKQRQTDCPAYVVPEWARLLTGGVDVQENSLYWVVRAWGANLTSQNVAHGQALSLGNIVDVMNTPFEKADGQSMLVDLALIDSGDQTDDIYEFCANNTEWALPCKGASSNMESYFKISQVNKVNSAAYGMRLIRVDTAKYKDLIAGRMRKPNGKGAWMVHAEVDDDYASQVTAEHKVTEGTGSRQTLIWKKKTTKADNHYFDAEVYCAAAADLMGVRQLFLHENKETTPPKTAEPSPATQTQAEENWIGRNESSWV